MNQLLTQLADDIATIEQGKSIMSYMDNIDVQLVDMPKMFILHIRKTVQTEGYQCTNALFEAYVTDPVQITDEKDKKTE